MKDYLRKIIWWMKTFSALNFASPTIQPLYFNERDQPH